MPTAVIIDAVRTPVGRRGGRLSGWHATDLAAQPLAALLARNDLDPALVEDVVMGCTMTVGEQAMNIARNAALAAGFPESVPGTTVDRQCGSAQQAIHFAAQAVMSGAMDVAIGAGSVTVCHLVNLAYWHNRKLAWDPQKWEFPGDAEANAWRDRERRGGYQLPEI